jgi:hypothetical protein
MDSSRLPRSGSRRRCSPDLGRDRRHAGLLRATAVWLLLAGCRDAAIDPASDGEHPPRRFLEPPTEFPAVFSVIRAVMALPDGRLVVSDPQENRVSLIDFPKGTSRLLGRVGEGPREFKRAGGLYRGRAGAVWVFDQELQRLLPVLPSGALQDVIPLPVGGIVGGFSARGPDNIFPDTLGHTYYARRGSGAGREGFTAQTAVLLRYRPGVRPDSVTQLLRRVTKTIEARPSGLGSYQDVLFSPEDAWIAAPDGGIAVVRAAAYRVEWIPLAGATVSGPAISHKQIPISQAEKELIASGVAGSRGRTTVSIAMVPPGGPSGALSGAPVPMPVGELLFAKFKTPVNLRENRWPRLDESGRVWVERSQPFGVKVSVFDVFDRSGKLVDRVELPAGSRLVGFDQHWIYAARLDGDDFEHLQRFPLPR